MKEPQELGPPTPAVPAGSPGAELAHTTTRQYCRQLHLPTIAAQFEPLAQAAERGGQPHVCYLEALLAAEVEERERHAVEVRLREAKLPRLKTLEEFDFAQM